MTMTMVADLLTDDMLARFDERASVYDRENRFFSEDFDELRESGYLKAAVPEEFGGAGLLLDEVTRLQRRLAYVAPATAVGVNMHIYWTGVAAELHRSGDTSCSWMLEEAGAGKIFAAGHGEAGNDLPLLMSSAKAVKVDGGWEFTGHKIFGSLTPVWDYLGLHAMDTADPNNPQIVHAFLPRASTRYTIQETWDTLGMRATASQDTILEQTFVPDDRIAVVCPAGFAGAGLFHVSIFAWGLSGFAAVYSGIAKRAFDITVSTLPNRSSVALTRSLAYHPEAQHHVADMRMGLEMIDAMVDRLTTDWATGQGNPDDWPVRIVATKHMVVNKAFEIVDRALDLTGGAGIFKRNRIEQLFRDCRLGRVHPANDMLAHELIGKLALGINPDEQPRWG